uniref:ABC transporter ATP-binding protein n=1 Tax=Candidatus Methanomethylicus mesodigestus TaxID=1867258 RepID=A0A7C3J494_9CREN
MIKPCSKVSETSPQGFLDCPTLLECRDVKKRFRSSVKGSFLALDGVSISLKKGELLAVIGESGSGKTTLAKILAGLIGYTSGEVFFGNKPLAIMDSKDMLDFRMKVQFIPQYPDLALDPTWYIYDSIAEPLRIHRIAGSREDELEKVRSISSLFGLGLDQLRRKPRDLSGGELQRAVLVRSMVLNPDVVIADEPTSMLDPSTQAKIVRQLLEAQKRNGFAVLFVTHDLRLAMSISNRVCVMLGGRIIESGDTPKLFSSPLHPYTSSLLSGVITGSEVNGGAMCPFYNQCNLRIEACLVSTPPELRIEKGRSVRCWLYGIHY